MAKDKSSSKKSEKSDDLESMRDAFRRHKERAKGGGGGGDNAWDKLGDGKNMRRILPRPGERKFYTEGWTHFNVGPNDRAVRCIDEAHINVDRGLPEPGTKCPLCKKFLREQSRINSEYQKGDEDGRAEWRRAKDKYVPRRQHYANVLVADDDGDVEVKILTFGTQIWSLLMNYYVGDDTAIGDFTKPQSGRWMNIKKEKKGGGRDRRNIEYKVFPASESTDISDAWDEIKGALHDLEAAAGKIFSKDEIVAIMKGVDPDKGSDSDEDDEDEDEDDDSSSDSGSEEEEEKDEDSEDEEERPSKKSQLSLKMGKSKKRRDD